MPTSRSSYYMSRTNFFTFLLLYGIIVSCELKEEKISKDPGLNLVFSTDTILFDTLLTERASITKRLRIFNPNAHAIELTNIRVGSGDASDYSIAVNGKSGRSFNDQLIFGKDSLLVLVKVNIDPQDRDLPYLIKDSVIVEWNNNLVDVKLIAWGQDAIYMGRVVLCDMTLTSDRPYVFYDTILVNQNCHLQIEAGANLYFDTKAALLVWGRLTVAGDSGNRVVFRNSRFDRDYIAAPGQWPGINIIQGSTGNSIDYAIIENAISGITIGTPDTDTLPDLILDHTIIRHVSQSGIIGFTSDIIGRNLLVHNAGLNLIFNVAGGNYSYEHCTFSNTPSFFFADAPAVQFADYVLLGTNETIIEELHLQLKNNIIWGAGPEELLIAYSGESNSAFQILTNLIKSEGTWDGNFVSIEPNYPGFVDPDTFNYQLDSGAFSIGQALPGLILDDLDGKERDSFPDIGAYEYKDD